MDKPSSPRPRSDAREPAAIAFAGIAKRYRGREVLRDVSFEVPAGSSTAVAGVNGAGKSTLLRCLLDFCQADAGSIRIDGRDSTELQARRALGWLPERFVPPAHLDARECLHWLAGLRGMPLDAARLETLSAQLGLDEPALRTRARDLSKGMTQKLGLVSIGLSASPTWVLDEPMSGLDPLARRHVTRLIEGARHDGRTILFTSHGLRDLPALCDQLVVLHEGSVRFCGSPAQFSHQYGSDDLETAFLECVAPAAPEDGNGCRRASAAQAMA